MLLSGLNFSGSYIGRLILINYLIKPKNDPEKIKFKALYQGNKGTLNRLTYFFL